MHCKKCDKIHCKKCSQNALKKWLTEHCTVRNVLTVHRSLWIKSEKKTLKIKISFLNEATVPTVWPDLRSPKNFKQLFHPTLSLFARLWWVFSSSTIRNEHIITPIKVYLIKFSKNNNKSTLKDWFCKKKFWNQKSHCSPISHIIRISRLNTIAKS